VWLLALPLAVAASQAAHGLAYRLVAPDAHSRATLLAASGHHYLTYLPLALAVASALVAFAFVSEVRHLAARGQAVRGSRPSAWYFAALAPAIFCFQEHFERLAETSSIPFTSALEPTFLVGLLLQLPFALGAYLLARLLLRAARSVGRWLATARRRRTVDVAPPRPPLSVVPPRVPALALGYGTRGPPNSLH
jgi:hypothetical protein